MIEDINQDAGISFVTPTKVSSQEDQSEDQLGVLSAVKVLATVAKKNVNTYTRRRRAVSTAGASMPVSTVGMVQQVNIIIPSSSETTKDKELAQKLHEEEQARFNAEQEAKFNAEQEELLISETTKDEANPPVADTDCDDVQAQIQADKDLAQKLLEEEREIYPLKKGQDYLQNSLTRERSYKLHNDMRQSEINLKPCLSKERPYTRKYWKIIRVGNHTETYQTFDDMLKKFDRDDLDKIWSLVKERFSLTDPTDDKERTLWVDLKRLFKPDTDDIYMHNPLVWKLYDTCGVHHVSSVRGHDIFMLVEKDYPLTRGILTLMLANKLQVDEYSEMANELLRKIFILANKPRQQGVWKHPLSTNGLI
ncbi:hypothetical protein Tco_0629181 [Tanacetum coccineum]|uniref:Uncharacterized protein n=1 Tax=Tanacetum coccineum TaxID=301880 RepID=A0ABQ4WSE9_9ASTR